jgi:hypothetical protein
LGAQSKPLSQNRLKPNRKVTVESPILGSQRWDRCQFTSLRLGIGPEKEGTHREKEANGHHNG